MFGALTSRRLLYVVAVALVLVGAAVTPVVGAGFYVQLAGALTLPLAYWLPRHRAVVLAAGGALAAAFVVQTDWAGATVLALVFLSTAEDPRWPPWVGVAGGVLGGGVGTLMTGSTYAIQAAFVVTVLGGGGAVLLRVWERSTQLRRETEVLRGQTAWLETRTALARELHDVVGHHVTAMVVQAEAGRLGDAPHVALARIAESGRTALHELDSLVVHLRRPGDDAPSGPLPRLADIDTVLAVPLRASGTQVHVRLAEGLVLSDDVVRTLYRIAQEGLTNVARHARAGHVWVELDRHGDHVALEIRDDGLGPPSTVSGGSGLLGIRERALAHGGRAELTARHGGGALLDVSIPVLPR
ncbi:hypothetical protein JQN72_08530 [Phycicoccus sp. CSK15P-2]|uniref:sensor histidine kinase n=1 Tax=Phycicoccus sp. CSK15P-2 TaxID=2807627 RepID=UPI00194E5AA7|nr:histidine kinase [Phycicoccus sp. CSK15P-2]MBM6404287.1 hypothetical protein [Phycicoccus sp. CSK15P-2]